MQLQTIQNYLQTNHLDGWLLYDFRGQNSIALAVAGLTNSGTRRWFLWIPAQGRPSYLIHAIEQAAFAAVAPQMQGEKHLYIGWQQLAEKLPAFVGAQRGKPLRIAMEYSPLGALPYISKVDAGTLELITEVTGAEIVGSADLVQLVQAVLSPAQMESHRRAAAHCMRVKDEAFAFVADGLKSGRAISEYDVQSFLMEQFAAAGLYTDHAPIVAVNGNAAVPHYAPSAEQHSPIRMGDVLLIDLWAKEQNDPGDCYADITWTAYCGAAVPEQVERVFRAVVQARDAAVSAIREAIAAGRRPRGHQIDDVARDVITAAGFGAAILHRTGHSLGPAMHWNGVNIDNVETQDRRRIIPGVMFTIEPGIYLPALDFDGSGQAKGLGIRSEVNCIAHEDSLEIATGPIQMEMVTLL
ncbi:MAG: aminopeptidase P family protein [Chloroflexi bacterium]|nr:MAG: aminopeptidase P family protein [Chloroflexota bacterium]